jgi:DNA invertase Pin-like site-specific DNA recombinase
MARAIGYIRVSTGKQADSGLGLDAQRAGIAAYAAANGVELVDVVVEAVSAKNLLRAGLGSALSRLDAGEADALLVYKLDRLTRGGVVDLSTLIEKHFTGSKSLLSVCEHIDARTAMGRLVLNVLASVGQWEREAIGERTRDALAALKATGRKLGHAAAEHDQATVDYASALRADGHSFQAIADQLAAAGHKPAAGHCTGDSWTKGSVLRMLARAA